jgi:uncharacterized protein with PIN domain
MSMIIRHRCFRCGFAYHQFVNAQFVHAIFKKGRHDEDESGFPRCPDCKKPVQLVTYEEVKIKKGKQ